MGDRLSLAHAIEDAGIPRDKAESVATAIARFVEGSSATKADVEAVATQLRLTEASVKAEIQRLDAKIERVADRTFNRLGTLVVVVAGVLFGLLHLWPPH